MSPAASAFFAIKGGRGREGLTVDLVRGFAAALKLPLELKIYDNSGQVTEAVATGRMRHCVHAAGCGAREAGGFRPRLLLHREHVSRAGGLHDKSIEEVNRPGRRIVAISNTTTARSARRTAPNASVEEVPSVDQMTEMAGKGQGDAFALSHDSFTGLAAETAGCAGCCPVISSKPESLVAVPKGRPVALKIASELIEVAKSSGLVRRALDAAGFPDAVVAPPVG